MRLVWLRLIQALCRDLGKLIHTAGSDTLSIARGKRRCCPCLQLEHLLGCNMLHGKCGGRYCRPQGCLPAHKLEGGSKEDSGSRCSMQALHASLPHSSQTDITHPQMSCKLPMRSGAAKNPGTLKLHTHSFVAKKAAKPRWREFPGSGGGLGQHHLCQDRAVLAIDCFSQACTIQVLTCSIYFYK